MVGRWRANCTATGRPTYPSPTTATVGRTAFCSFSISTTSRTSSRMGHLALRAGSEQIGYVPVDRFLESFEDAVGRAEAEQLLRLGDVGLREAHVAAARLAVHRAHARELRQARHQQQANHLEQLVQRGLL